MAESLSETDGARRFASLPAVRCPGCGADVDPLRAGHVAIFDSRLRFFCNYVACRARFLGEEPKPAVESPRAAPLPAALVEGVRAAEGRPDPSDALPEAPPHDPLELIEPVAPLPVAEHDVPHDAPEDRDLSMLLVALTLVAGLLGMALELAEATSLVRVSRLLLVGVGTATLAGHTITGNVAGRSGPPTEERDASHPHWLTTVTAPILGFLVALAALWAPDPAVGQRAIFLASTIVSVGAACVWLTAASARPVERGRRWIQHVLGGSSEGSRSNGVEAGRAVIVGVDELVPVDLEVTEGEATVVSWVVGTPAVRRRPSDSVVAGSRVVGGQLRGVCTHAGNDRALARALFAPQHRPDVHSDTARLGRDLVTRGAVAAAMSAAVMHAALRGKPFDVAMVAVAVYAALSTLSLAVLPSLTIARGLLLALDRGVVYRTAAAWDRAARATAAVFSARGTLLRGEPELVEIEVFGRGEGPSHAVSANDVLALAAAALGAERTPTARALKRAARDRALPADLVRNGRSHEGHGVTGVASNGEAVCVGTRELMLDRRVSFAVAESAMAELEAAGRTVVLVARAGRLLGLCGLQDGLRSGARAAVQHLLDARVEPVLMSSDTTATCEALGRALDIDHLRPGVREEEQGGAIERIRDTGAVVAVLGHTPADASGLRAADVAIALGQAGRSGDDLGIVTVSDDVRDASLGIALAQTWRKRATATLAVIAGPAAFGSLVVAAGILAPEYAPIASLCGSVAAAWQLTREDGE